MDPPKRDGERHLAELLVEERVAQLEEISRRRNSLLREMFLLLQKRHNIGEVVSIPKEGELDETEALNFLERFDLHKHPETGSVSMLTDEDLTVPLSFDQLERTPIPEPSLEPEPPVNITSPTPPIDITSPTPPVDITSPTPPVGIASPIPPPTTVASETDADHSTGQIPQPAEMERTSPMDVYEELPAPPSQAQDREDLATGASEATTETEPVTSPDHSQPRHVLSAVQEAEVVASNELGATVTAELDRRRSPATAVMSPSLLRDDPMEITQTDIAMPAPAESAPVASATGPSPTPAMDVDNGSDVHTSQSVNPQDTILAPTKADKSLLPDMAYSSSEYPPSPITFPPPSVPTSITVFSALTPIQGLPDFTFPASAEPTPEAEPVQKNSVHFHLNRQYTVPSLKILPAEFQRKGKNKQRKRDKERDKAERGSDREGRKEARDDWTQMGINKWGALMRANPLWRRMSRATKCLSTHEWSVAFEELRFIRTLERIEALKEAGSWSYRQPKKQRGVGGLKKTHWDYLLDEMKWMRVDFREERKWKIALAYELSTAVLEWHKAGSRKERMRLGLIVDWHKPPVHADEVYDSPEELDTEPMETDTLEQENMMAVDSGSDDSDDDQEQDKQDVVDALEANALVDEALTQVDIANEGEEPQSAMSDFVRPKEEEMEDPSVLHGASQDESMQVDSQQTEATQDSQGDAPTHPGLKDTSRNPILTESSQAQQAAQSVHAPALTAKALSKSNAYMPLRSHIAYSDEHQLFLDLDDFHLVKRHDDTSFEGGSMDALPAPADLSAIFPDLQCFGILDVAPAPATSSSTENKKKQEKRDRDDPHKRAEDTTYSKLTPLSRFMREKPTLLGTLEPSKHWKGDHWSGIDDAPVVPDFEAPPKVIDDSISSLFDHTRGAAGSVDDDTMLLGTSRDTAKRIMDSHWTPQDDLLLKRLAEKYPRNWGLITDIFNSSRGAISTEKRLEWECKERYKAKWLAGERVDRDANATPGPSTATPARPQPQMTTRKRLASVSASAAPSISAPAPPVEPKKRRRHVLMYDTIRKMMKKREASHKSSSNSANPRRPSVVHDTHGQFNKLPKLTPAELSRMKADKEAREQQDALMRRRNDEYTRQQMLMRDSAQRLAAQGAAVQAVPPGTPNAAARQPNNGVQHHQVPQIRSQVNISQQQRVPSAVPVANAAAAAAARMSPQQMLQAQVAQQRALAAAAAAGNVNLAAATSSVNGHLSPPYASRAATSSPAVSQASPPRSSATPHPRPTSAQQHVGATQASPNMQQTAIPRAAANMAHYFPMPNAQLTPEQAIRIQQIMQQQQQRQAMQNSGQQGQGGQPGQAGQYPQS